jgi:hypothetical protein
MASVGCGPWSGHLLNFPLFVERDACRDMSFLLCTKTPREPRKNGRMVEKYELIV